MKQPQSAAIYARISRDQEGSGMGVARQLEDCHRLADSLGWAVTEEYVDNDVSAYTRRKVRPAFQRMVADITDGRRDAVVIYHPDRLTRQPFELEQFLVALDSAKVRSVRFVVGDMDLGTGDGLMVVRIMLAM